MAHSLSPVQDSDGPEDYVVEREFTRGKRTYAVEREDDKVFHHERQADEHGNTIYDQAVQVHYAIGSGKRGRSYLIDRGGLLLMSSLSWYTQARRWDLSPGYAEDNHERFERRVGDRCLSCHAGRVAPDPAWCDRFQEKSPILEFGIGCERCHGPGGEHVAWHQAATPAAGDDPIVNPARLEPARRESVCNQCHLHGEEVLRYGRNDFDFRPGMHVGEVWSIEVTPHTARSLGTTAAVSQVQQMLVSTCAQQSAGRLGCISCHDPHGAPAESEKHAMFRDKCLACHGVSECQEEMERRLEPAVHDSCIICHMPPLAASDIPHTTQTDHSIPRRPDHGERTSRGAVPGEPEVFDMAGAPLTELERSRVRGLLLAKVAGKSRIAAVAQRAAQDLEPVLLASPDDSRAAEGLASAWSLSKRDYSAIALWKRLLTISPVREETLLGLALTQHRRGSIEDALMSLDRLLEVNPWRASFWLRRSQLLQQLGRQDEALAASRRALQLDPSLIDAYRQLSEICGRRGLTDEAAGFRETIRRLKGR